MKGNNKMHAFQLKLKDLKAQLKLWNKRKFGNIFEDKLKLEGEMAEIQQRMITEGRT